jgi:hypothetical protein
MDFVCGLMGLFSDRPWGRARLMLISMMQTLMPTDGENLMTITASRLSDTEVLVEQTVYTFSDSAVADAFQRCVGQDSVDSCTASHAPMSSRASNDAALDDLAPGSIISPSLGGMP